MTKDPWEDPTAEYVRAVVGKYSYENPMHLECFVANLATHKITLKSATELMMNKFFNDKLCCYCGVKLQCSCSPYKVSDPTTGKCSHAN